MPCDTIYINLVFLLLNLASRKEPFFCCEKLISFCISTCPIVFIVCPFRIENAKGKLCIDKVTERHKYLLLDLKSQRASAVTLLIISSQGQVRRMCLSYPLLFTCHFQSTLDRPQSPFKNSHSQVGLASQHVISHFFSQLNNKVKTA